MAKIGKKNNVSAGNLAETVKRWNEQITAGADKDLGRPLEKKDKVAFEGREAPIISRPIGEGPYYAAESLPSHSEHSGRPEEKQTRSGS